jgi:hypothetical protein
MQLIRRHSSTSNILRVVLRSSATGAGLTGLAHDTSGLIISTVCDNEASATTYTVAGSTIETVASLGTFAAPTATKCRFKEVDATNHPGLYELQLADARFSVASAKQLDISISGAANLLRRGVTIQLDTVPATDGAGAALPTAAAVAEIKAQTDLVVGSGATSVAITVNDGSTGIQGVSVWITSNSSGTTVVAGAQSTNSSGVATFMLDVASTYYVWCRKDGYNAIRGTSFVASGSGHTFSMTAAAASAGTDAITVAEARALFRSASRMGTVKLADTDVDYAIQYVGNDFTEHSRLGLTSANLTMTGTATAFNWITTFPDLRVEDISRVELKNVSAALPNRPLDIVDWGRMTDRLYGMGTVNTGGSTQPDMVAFLQTGEGLIDAPGTTWPTMVIWYRAPFTYWTAGDAAAGTVTLGVPRRHAFPLFYHGAPSVYRFADERSRMADAGWQRYIEHRAKAGGMLAHDRGVVEANEDDYQ